MLDLLAGAYTLWQYFSTGALLLPIGFSKEGGNVQRPSLRAKIYLKCNIFLKKLQKLPKYLWPWWLRVSLPRHSFISVAAGFRP